MCHSINECVIPYFNCEAHLVYETLQNLKILLIYGQEKTQDGKMGTVLPRLQPGTSLCPGKR